MEEVKLLLNEDNFTLRQLKSTPIFNNSKGLILSSQRTDF
jgi:hypothetical protein